MSTSTLKNTSPPCYSVPMRLVRFVVLVCILAGFTLPARAGGYFIPDRGVRAFSRGGAAVVGCDDLSALWYNPAQLAAQPGTRIHLDFTFVLYAMRFERAPVPEVDEEFGAVRNRALPLPGPSLAISSDFGLDDFVFAAGFYTPYGNWSDYPAEGPQRYSNIHSENLAFFLQAAAAWEPLDGLRLGAGLNLFSLHINDTHAVSAFPGLFGAPEDRDLDGAIQVLAKDDFIPTANIGLWLGPGAWIPALEGLELGVSFMPAFSVSATGRMRIRLPDHVYYDGVTVDPAEPPVRVEMDFPWMVRTGIRYVGLDGLFDVELDLVWEGWSTLDAVRTTFRQPAYYRDIPTIGDYLITAPENPRHFRDTLSVRLGGSVRPLDWLVLRAGMHYESGAPPDAYYTVATPDSNKVGLALGAGVVLGAFEIDFGYMHTFLEERIISPGTSKAVQTNPSNPEAATTVGGGKYTASYDFVGASLLCRLDWFWRMATGFL